MNIHSRNIFVTEISRKLLTDFPATFDVVVKPSLLKKLHSHHSKTERILCTIMNFAVKRNQVYFLMDKRSHLVGLFSSIFSNA